VSLVSFAVHCISLINKLTFVSCYGTALVTDVRKVAELISDYSPENDEGQGSDFPTLKDITLYEGTGPRGERSFFVEGGGGTASCRPKPCRPPDGSSPCAVRTLTSHPNYRYDPEKAASGECCMGDACPPCDEDCTNEGTLALPVEVPLSAEVPFSDQHTTRTYEYVSLDVLFLLPSH